MYFRLDVVEDNNAKLQVTDMQCLLITTVFLFPPPLPPFTEYLDSLSVPLHLDTAH